jgi:hypothetical protein
MMYLSRPQNAESSPLSEIARKALILVTMYRPSFGEWDGDFRVRRIET